MTDPLPDAPARLLGERIFSATDQRWFGDLSLDVNPMHIDEIAARRLLSGRQVVHGIHTLIQAIDWWQAPVGHQGLAMTCTFDHPVSVGDVVQYCQTENGPNRSVIKATVDGLVCTEIGITHDKAALGRASNRAPPHGVEESDGAESLRTLGGLRQPLDESAASWSGQHILVPAQADGPALATRYPTAAQALSPAAMASLAGLSYFVGMVCPGLHSVFSSLSFRLGQPAPADGQLLLRVTRFTFW